MDSSGHPTTEKLSRVVSREQLEHAVDSDSPDQGPGGYDEKHVKAVLRKIDFRLLPVLTILYLLCYIDRGNIGNARVAGMNEDLNLTPAQYNMALTVGGSVSSPCFLSLLMHSASGTHASLGLLHSLRPVRGA